MTTKTLAVTAALLMFLAGGYMAYSTRVDSDTESIAGDTEVSSASSSQSDRVFELRTYTAAEGKHDALVARFRDHTLRIFEKHGMTNVGYWTPQDAPESANTLVYVLAHASREQAAESWAAFIADPEWQAVAEESQRDGRLIVGLESVFLDPTDFSPLR